MKTRFEQTQAKLDRIVTRAIQNGLTSYANRKIEALKKEIASMTVEKAEEPASK